MLRKFWSKFVIFVAGAAGLRQERAHHFYPGTLRPESLVVDLGVHRGEFSRFITSTYGCAVLGLEANPDLFATLPALPRTRFLNLAINRDNSPVVFHISDNPEASSVIASVAQVSGDTRPVSVQGVTLDQLWQDHHLAMVALLKVDIESAEFEMLERASDETLTRAAQITVEFHLGPAGSEFSKDRFQQISRRLARLGFATYIMDRKFTDVLFLNIQRVVPTFSQRLALAVYRCVIMPARSLF